MNKHTKEQMIYELEVCQAWFQSLQAEIDWIAFCPLGYKAICGLNKIILAPLCQYDFMSMHR